MGAHGAPLARCCARARPASALSAVRASSVVGTPARTNIAAAPEPIAPLAPSTTTLLIAFMSGNGQQVAYRPSPDRRLRNLRTRAQDHPRDLERRQQADRRSPVAAAARHVEHGVADVVAALEQATLLQLDDVVPRPDLAAVGVPGQLEVDAVQDRVVDLARLGG